MSDICYGCGRLIFLHERHACEEDARGPEPGFPQCPPVARIMPPSAIMLTHLSTRDLAQLLDHIVKELVKRGAKVEIHAAPESDTPF